MLGSKGVFPGKKEKNHFPLSGKSLSLRKGKDIDIL